MFKFAMDCLFLGMTIVLLIQSSGHYENDNEMYKKMTILSIKIGIMFFALTNWIVGFGILWSMWE